MADPRLLIATMLLLSFGTGCALGPIWACGVKGEVVDEETGEPIEGALVFAVYQAAGGTKSWPIDVRWTTTDAEGRFEIPGRFSMTLGGPLSYTERDFFVDVAHPDYGKFIKSSSTSAEEGHSRHRFRFELAPNFARPYFEDPRKWPSMCIELGREGCDRMCEYAYGSVEACYAADRPRP